MHQGHDHFKQATAAEAMRLMDEELLSLDEAFEKAKREFSGVTGYEAPDHRDNLAVATPSDTD